MPLTPPPPAFARVPRLCPGGTVALLASGPSLTEADVAACRDQVDATIVINTTYTRAPWATALYAADAHWWDWHQGAPTFPGLKYTVAARARHWPDVQLLENTGEEGLEAAPTGLRMGRNSGYQAMNLAVHFGATRLLLLGYDCQFGAAGERHWHSDHPREINSPFVIFREKFGRLAPLLAARGVEVLNCSRRTALDCFPRVSLHDALARPS